MASVTDRNSKKHREFGLLEGEAPEPAISEETLLVKRLAQKQFLKETSLAEQLNVKQTFVSSSSDLQAISEFPSGTSSLANFSANACHLDLKGFLISNGLNNDEVEFFFDIRKGREFLKLKFTKIHPFALDKKIAELFKKIKNGPSNIDSKNCNLECNSTFYPPNHPINQLREIENSLFGCQVVEKDVDSKSKSRKKRRLNNEDINSYLPDGCSQWDQKKVKKYKTAASRISETVVKSCAPQTWYAIKNGKCVFLGKQPPPEDKQPKSDKTEKILSGVPFVAPNQSLLVSLDVIKSGRLNDDEIRCLPKFEKYDRGLPTSTLFLKNLSHGVEENDLARIFGNYEEVGCPAIVYRLMGGRMKGQAFLIFSSFEKAAAALEDVNGFQLKGKPIIIQFGNKKT